MRRPLNFIVPGPLDQRTGGYIYDRRIVEGLRATGWQVEVHELNGRFPDADDVAKEAASAAILAMGDGVPIIDGLALPAFDGISEKLPRPWIGLIHHPLAMETGLSADEVATFAELESRLMRRADRLIVTSPMTRRNLRGFDIDPEDVAVVIPGVDLFPPAKGSEEGAPTSLLCVGSLTRRKGHPVLISALATLTDLDWYLRIVGSAAWDHEHAAGIEALIEDEGLAERVTMIGEQDEAGLAELYDEADLFVLASHHEGYGMVLTEALARGLPIVSTTAGAIPDTVPASAGRLVEPGDAEALAAAIRDLLTERAVYAELKAGACAARDNLTSWAEAASGFAAVIEQTLQR